MATKAEVLRLLRFRDQLTTRDVETILDYVDQEILTAVVLPGSVGVSEEGTPLAGAPHTILDFVGADITASDAGSGVATITVSVAGGITIEEEGSPIAGGPHDTLNFVGTFGAVTATDAGGGVADITVAPQEIISAANPAARATMRDIAFPHALIVDTDTDGVVFPAKTRVMIVASSGFSYNGADATLLSQPGSGFNVNCGDGFEAGNGGAVVLVPGNGGLMAGGDGGNSSIFGGQAGAGSGATGGDIFFVPGDGDGAGIDGAVVIDTTRVGEVASELRFLEDGNQNGNYVGLKARDVIATNRIYILPEGGQTNEMVLGIDLGEFTVAGLPAATANANCSALATNASGGRTLVRSDGTDWKVVVVEGATVTT